jgi:hypothetical protein
MHDYQVLTHSHVVLQGAIFFFGDPKLMIALDETIHYNTGRHFCALVIGRSSRSV